MKKITVSIVIIIMNICYAGYGRIIPRKPIPFKKTNQQKIFVHYTPWYETPAVSGKWGWHWRMNSRNPDHKLPNGRHDIASHFYPLIGPYDTSDPHLLEYHVLLMKLSGIDGAIVNWYGRHDIYDYLTIDRHAGLFINWLEKAGLQLIIMYEDRCVGQAIKRKLAGSIQEKMQVDFKYLEKNYFGKSIYYLHNGEPVLGNFGPIVKDGVADLSEWKSAFAALKSKPVYFPIWGGRIYQEQGVSSQVPGGFAWCVNTNGKASVILNDRKYADRAVAKITSWYQEMQKAKKSFIVGIVYPGFQDYWREGKAGFGPFGYTPYDNGQTFKRLLDVARVYCPNILQIVTWNDFQEGTQVEPTTTHGYKYLTMLQKFSGNGLKEKDLQMAVKIYSLRKLYPKNKKIQNRLTNIFYLIVSNRLKQARKQLAKIK